MAATNESDIHLSMEEVIYIYHPTALKGNTARQLGAEFIHIIMNGHVLAYLCVIT